MLSHYSKLKIVRLVWKSVYRNFQWKKMILYLNKWIYWINCSKFHYVIITPWKFVVGSIFMIMTTILDHRCVFIINLSIFDRLLLYRRHINGYPSFQYRSIHLRNKRNNKTILKQVKYWQIKSNAYYFIPCIILRISISIEADFTAFMLSGRLTPRRHCGCIIPPN